MAVVRAITGQSVLPLTAGWRMARTPAGAYALPPHESAALHWIAAIVPGTVAGSLAAAGLWDVNAPQSLDDHDFWYCTLIEGQGGALLRLKGLATIAEVWLDGVLILQSDNMFHAHELAIDVSGSMSVAICFRSLASVLDKPQRRARWRTRVVQPASLRSVRTSLLGHMPGWCPPVTPVGPWRAVELVWAGPVEILTTAARVRVEGTTGIVEVTLGLCGPFPADAQLICAGASIGFTFSGSGQASARLEIPNVALWWPHTHGEPRLHRLDIAATGFAVDMGTVGFRTIERDTDYDGQGFGLRVNGVDVFCRGSVWINPDIVTLGGSRDDYAPTLTLMRDAHMNMVRVGGTGVYETAAFFELCDELGILVWQDLMLANLDYPFDVAAFRTSAETEVQLFLDGTQTSPALAVICGGSEVYQQASMMGLPPSVLANSWYETALPVLVEDLRPGAVFVPNSPFGGTVPFAPQSGLTHYYGVSAYLRPLSDVRHANVRFASECLGFANVPEMQMAFEPGEARLHHECWGERLPRDSGATWLFEDVRNHYVNDLYGVSAQQALAGGQARYLALARAVNVELMEAVCAEFRQTKSSARGALTWFLKDVWPGAGWGLLDHAGNAKSVYYALRRAFAPVQILMTDEGLNGMMLHAINETGRAVEAHVSLLCLADGAVPVMQGEALLHLAARARIALPATDVWGGFFDTNYAYRFGESAHDVTIATLACAQTGEMLAQAFQFPLGRGSAQHELGLGAQLHATESDYFLELSCQRFAQNLRIADAGFSCDDNYFHLAPGLPRRVRLTRRAQMGGPPRGTVSALNGIGDCPYGEAP